VLCTTGQVGDVARRSVSEHHRNSALQKTELRQVYGDTGMTVMDWETGVGGATGITEVDGATGSIYLEDPGVDTISSCIILSYNQLHTVSFPSFDLTHSFRDFVDPPRPVVSYRLTC